MTTEVTSTGEILSQNTGTISIAPWDGSYWYPTYPLTFTTQPTECSGDVHVFPCKRCRTCKCGKATLSAKKG